MAKRGRLERARAVSETDGLADRGRSRAETQMAKEILVVGATGNLGGMITRRLLDQGRAVRILVRGGSSYQPLEEAGAEVAKGDLKQRSSLD